MPKAPCAAAHGGAARPLTHVQCEKGAKRHLAEQSEARPYREPPPAFGAKIRADFIHGMGKVDGKFVIILDTDKVLSMNELSMLGQAAGAISAAQAEAVI